MNKEDLGKYFIKDGEIYYCIGYISQPALELKNLMTGQKEVIVIGSMLEKEYSKLFKISCNDGYNLNSAEEVDNIELKEMNK